MRSELGNVYAVAFEGMEMEARDGDTVLTGRFIDQTQLYGILERTNGLGGISPLGEMCRWGKTNHPSVHHTQRR